jgi:hypothetical protein
LRLASGFIIGLFWLRQGAQRQVGGAPAAGPPAATCEVSGRCAATCEQTVCCDLAGPPAATRASGRRRPGPAAGARPRPPYQPPAAVRMQCRQCPECPQQQRSGRRPAGISAPSCAGSQNDKLISTRGVAKVNFLSITQNGRRMCAWLDELQRGHHRSGV